MKRKRMKWISLPIALIVMLAGSSLAVYGGETIPAPGNAPAVVQGAEMPGSSGASDEALNSGKGNISGALDETEISEKENSEGTQAPAAEPASPEQTEAAASEHTSETENAASPEQTAETEDAAPEQPETISDPEAEDSADAQELSAQQPRTAEDVEEEILSDVVQLLSKAGNATPGGPGLTATKGVYWFTPSLGAEGDLTDTFIYDDEQLKGDSLAYNKQLATMSFEMAVASISSWREPQTPEGYANKSRNLKAYLEDNGFTDFAVNHFYTEQMTETSMGVACAHKQITDNGKTYTLLVVAPRSAGYEDEWGSNFMMGAEGDHEGFTIAKDHVLEFVKQYVDDYGISGDIKVWTAGYSRGAAVTDLVAAAMLNDPGAALGSAVTLDPENLYCYTFGTPRNADADGDYQDTKYLYVHNTYALYDIITAIPPADLGFERYGSDTPLIPDDENAKAQMLELLQELNPVLWQAYTNGGDPDGFRAKTIDIEALFDGELKLKDDDSSYLPDNQADFVSQIFSSSLMDAIGTRENYAEVYQGPMVRFGKYFFTHTDEVGDLAGEIMQSPYAIPAGAAMYMYILTEKFLGNETPSSDHSPQSIYNYLQSASELIGKLDLTTIPETSELRELILDFYNLTQQGIVILLQRPNILEQMSGLVSGLYALALRDGLEGIGADEDLTDQLTSYEDSKAMSRIFSYLFFEDGEQQDTSLINMNENMIKHAATFLGNGTSYLFPHMNEVMVSWLKVQDEYYNGIQKENAAQVAGYRRLYIEQPEGVDVTGYVKDGSGKVVAVFKNGELISRTNDWIGMTTSDNGNWLRLPVDDTYNVEFEISDDTTLTIVVSEYDVYDNKEVRIETSDSKLSWKDLALRTIDKATLIISSLTPDDDGSYAMNSDAPYYIDLLKRFTIQYQLDGGVLNKKSGTVSVNVDDGTSITLPAPTRKGYKFAYWRGSRYNAGDSYTVTEDHTFTAVWKKVEDKKKPEKDSSEDTDEDKQNTDSEQIVGPVLQPVAQGKAVPKTGDTNQLWYFYAAMFLSASVIVLLLFLRHRKAKEK